MTIKRTAVAFIFGISIALIYLAALFYRVYATPVPRTPINAEYDRIPVVMGANYWLPGDFHGVYFTIDNGIRRTVGQPVDYGYTIWIFGNSSTFDWNVTDADTMTSQLQSLFNAAGYHARIVNMAVPSYRLSTELARLRDTRIQPGDIVIFIDGAAEGRAVIVNGDSLQATVVAYSHFLSQAQAYSAAHHALFFHFIQPYVDDSLQSFYSLIPGHQIRIQQSGFVELAHLNELGDALVAGALYRAITEF